MSRFTPWLLLALAGCQGTVFSTVRAPDLPYVEHEAPPAPPEVIAVRVALVSYAGAEGAPPSVTRTQEDAADRARLLSGYARQPEQSFREVQTMYSDAPATLLQLRRGDARLPAQVVEAAFALRVGERSSAIETPAGYYLVARDDDPQLGPTSVMVRHVLISHADARQAPDGTTRTRDEARALAEQVREQALTDPSRFAELAAEFSDEPGAAESGGDLGTVARGVTVPSFERAAFALENGAISAVVESPFGFHVILRYQ